MLTRIDKADATFYARNIAYWNRFMDDVEAAFDKPYAEAYAELGALDKDKTYEYAFKIAK